MYRNEVHVLFVVTSTLVLGTVGCQGNGKPLFSNPFSASGRVPPPATRSLGPGSAQPYYPGDPVPVLQGATPPAGPPLVSTTPVVPTVAPPVTAVKTPQIQPVSLVPGGTAGPVPARPNRQFAPANAPVAVSPATPSFQPGSPATPTSTSGRGNFVSPAAWRNPGLTAVPGASPITPAVMPPAAITPTAMVPAAIQPAGRMAPRIRLPGNQYVPPPTHGLQTPVQQASFVATPPAAAGRPYVATPQTASMIPQAAPTTPRPPVAHGWQTPVPFGGK